MNFEYKVIDIVEQPYSILEETLNKYGEGGWELVSVINTPSNKYKLFLKKIRNNELFYKQYCFIDKEGIAFCFNTQKELDKHLKKYEL